MESVLGKPLLTVRHPIRELLRLTEPAGCGANVVEILVRLAYKRGASRRSIGILASEDCPQQATVAGLPQQRRATSLTYLRGRLEWVGGPELGRFAGT